MPVAAGVESRRLSIGEALLESAYSLYRLKFLGLELGYHKPLLQRRAWLYGGQIKSQPDRDAIGNPD
jgi:hypothetical protein